VSESEIKALKVQLERSKAARLRAWSVLQGLRDTLQAAGAIIPPSAEKSFAREGEFLERALKKALLDREEALRDLAKAARWVDRSAFGQQIGFRPGTSSAVDRPGKGGAFRVKKNFTQRRKGKTEIKFHHRDTESTKVLGSGRERSVLRSLCY
jgi:hypothetical protein